MTTHLLLTIDEAGERLNLGRSTVYQLMDSGELPSVHIGRRRLVPAAALQVFVDSLMEGRRPSTS